MSSTAWPVPGKVLFIDDHFDQVDEFMSGLSKYGVPVQYWNPNDSQDHPITNVRVVVLDLNLKDAAEDIRGTTSFYFTAAEALQRINGPYILHIFSEGFDERDIKGLKEAYLNKCKKEIKTVGDIKGIEKDDTNLEDFIEKIKERFQETDIFKMIVTWENLLNEAKDKSLTQLSEEGFDKEIKEFIKEMSRGLDENELAREFTNNMIRFISRYVNSGDEYEKLSNILKSIKNSSSEDVSNPLLKHLQMFYEPKKLERVWTGDIFEIDSKIESEDKKFWKYSIILTPACDIVQDSKKLETFLLCEGYVLDVESVKDPEHPFRKIRSFKFPDQGEKGKDEWDKDIQNKIWEATKNNLPEKFHPIWHMRKTNGEYFGICFDFQRIRSIRHKDLEEENSGRVYRLDSPFVDEMLQKFGSYSFRLGTPDINMPSKI